MPDPSRDKSSDSKPPPSRAWIGYIVITVVALAISGVFQRGGLRTVSYDEALALVEQGKVAEAAVEPDEVVLKQKAEGKQPAEEVRVTRLPGVWDEPLLKSLLDHKVKLDAQIPKSPLWTQALVWILPLVAINALFFFALRKMGGAGGVGGPLGALKSRAKIYDRNAEQQVHFDDVAGVDEAKDELEEVVAFLREPERYRALGGKIPRGILLIGPPGTGKTLLARAVAGEAKVPFFSLNASEFVEMFVGLGAARVRDVFEQAKKQAPSIVFVDEIDAVGRTRGGSMALASHDEREQTLHQLLAELDGFDARTTVIMMAATNRPEVLDPALLRPGRFDRQVVVDRPELAGRRAILGVHARGLPLDPAVDLDAVARRTPGMSGADLANVVNEAALSGARRGGKTITPADFAEAMDRAQLGLKRRGAIMTAAERKRVAYHETGHALVALGLPNADPVERVSIIARTIGALGHTLQVPRDDRHVVTEQELETRVTVLLAGRAAEELALGEVSTGAHDDLAKATDIVRNMVTRLGMSRHLGLPTLARNAGAPLLGLAQEERMMSEATAREVDEEVRERLAELYRKAKQLLAEGRAGLDAGAEALVQRETLSGDELAEIADAALIRANNERARGGSAA